MRPTFSEQRVVVVGGSAGALGPLKALCGALPVDFPAPILVVVHISPTYPSCLPRILTAAGPLPATHSMGDEKLTAGRVYVAPPDHHLVVGSDGSAQLLSGPCVNGFRPSIDVLFRTAAEVLGPAAVAVVLSGALDDGAAGAAAVRRVGGTVVVQDPDDATLGILPRHAVATAEPDTVLPAAQIPAALCRLMSKAEGPAHADAGVSAEVGLSP